MCTQITATLTIIIINNSEIVTNIFKIIIIIKSCFNQLAVSELFTFCYQMTASLNFTLRKSQVISSFLNLLQYLDG